VGPHHDVGGGVTQDRKPDTSIGVQDALQLQVL